MYWTDLFLTQGQHSIMATVLHLLDQYPASFAKTQAFQLLKRAETHTSVYRPFKFVVYDIVYALQKLEARRLGLRRDLHPEPYAAFTNGVTSALAAWVPGQDPFIDTIMSAATAFDGGRMEEVGKIFCELREIITAKEAAPQRNKPFTSTSKTLGVYIIDKLQENSNMTEAQLWREMENDSEYGSDDRIGEIVPEGVWIMERVPSMNEKKISLSIFCTRDAVRCRLSRMKKQMK